MKKLLVLILITIPTLARGEELSIRAEAVVKAPREAVWRAWTTPEGIKSFFAKGSNIDLRPDGAYEIFFAPDQPAGLRGADGMRLLLVQPPSVLAFTWNAPFEFPEQRKQRTHVMLRFTPIDDNTTRVLLVHDGFGDGPEWQKVRDYFQNAWTTFVLPRLVASFEKK
jgi:uncharacterized protein YndB with AHSA1/START domain